MMTHALRALEKILHRFENGAMVVLLAGMALLPVAEALLRKVCNLPLPGAAAYVMHGTLWVAFVGAAIAARNGSHLKIAAGAALVRGRAAAALQAATAGLTSAVAVAFIAASLQLIAAERGSLMTVAPLLPSWVAQIPMPVCMALLALSFFAAGRGMSSRLLTVATAGLLLCIAFVPEAQRAALLLPVLGLLAAALFAGAPLFAVFGGAALFLFFKDAAPLAAVPSETYRVVASPTLPTIPLFTLAGYILSEGGASRRMVGLFHALFGWMPGGVAVATVLVCAFFTTFTGASGVTILALGGLLLPLLVREKYPERFSLGLVTASGSVGLLFPPSLPIIIFGVVAAIPIDRMFVACVFPGVCLVLLVSAYGVGVARRSRVEAAPFSFSRLREALAVAKWDLLLPAIIIGGIFGGLATIVESAALVVLYAVILECFIHRELSLTGGLPAAMVKCGEVVGGVLIILGFAFGLTNYLIDADVPSLLAAWTTRVISSKLVFLILLNVLLVAVGCMMDIFSAIVVVVRILLPIAAAYGISPMHLGVMFLVNLELGYLMPPMGLNLFFSAYRFERPLPDIYRSVLPFLVLGAVMVALVTYFPRLMLWPVR